MSNFDRTTTRQRDTKYSRGKRLNYTVRNSIPVNPQSTQIWRRLEIFSGTKQASEGRGIEAKFEASLGGRGGRGGERGVQFIA